VAENGDPDPDFHADISRVWTDSINHCGVLLEHVATRVRGAAHGRAAHTGAPLTAAAGADFEWTRRTLRRGRKQRFCDRRTRDHRRPRVPRGRATGDWYRLPDTPTHPARLSHRRHTRRERADFLAAVPHPHDRIPPHRRTQHNRRGTRPPRPHGDMSRHQKLPVDQTLYHPFGRLPCPIYPRL